MGCLHQMNKRCSSSSSFVLHIPLFLMFFTAILLAKSMGVVSAMEYSGNKQASNLTLNRIHRYLRKMNKPAVKTVETPDGCIIACVDKWKQPAFDHPLLKNYKPQFPPEVSSVKPYNNNNNNNSSETLHVWPLFDPECPEGTVPIKRITVDDVLRAKSLQDFKRKTRGNPFATKNRTTISPNLDERSMHEYAIVSSRPGIGLYEASAAINVWTPHVASENELSISQLWLDAGEFNTATLNTIEVGWMVYPRFYGNSETHLFVYWTADNYQRTGCYNILCPGFVQIAKNVIVGSKLLPVSIKDGPQYEIILRVYKNQTTGDWWLNYGREGIQVGYWPAPLFTTLKESASQIQWGGEIINLGIDGIHTSTGMGSNSFAEEGPGKASYFKDVAYVDSTNYSGPPKDGISYAMTNPSCYNIFLKQNEHQFSFYYGGPGYNPRCLH